MQEFSAGSQGFNRFRDVVHDICDVTSRIAPDEFNNGFSLAARFEGEFSDTTQSSADKGTLRYNW